MKLETKIQDDHQIKITAEFEENSLEKYKRQAARKISEGTKIPGFRPGKAPFDVVRRLYGDDAIEKQAVEIMIDDVYPQIIDEAKIEPAASGQLEEIISSDPPKFSFVIPLAPEVELGKYQDIRKDYKFEGVADDEVESFLKRIQTSYATAEPVERPIEKGDLVYLKMKGTLKKIAEGENAEVIREAPMQTIVGENSMQEESWPFKGFSNELIGLNEKEEKTFSHKFKKDDASEELRGKEVEFHVTIESVKSLHLPEINDEFAKSTGNFETLEELKKSVLENLEKGKRDEFDRKYFDELIDEIIALSTIKYPPQVVEQEMESVLGSLQQDLAEQKMDLEAYLKLVQKDRETFLNDEIRPAAVKRLERSLVMDKLSHEEKIELSKEDLQKEFDKTLYDMQSTTDFKALRRKMSNERIANAIAMQAASKLMNNRILDRIKAIASGEGEVKIEAEEKPAPKKAKKKAVAKASEETGEANE
ncbi:MAG: trigger factor [Anaerolineaceae bacterium]|nr:trigger factor [Anaerolineaceae bacterium]